MPAERAAYQVVHETANKAARKAAKLPKYYS